MRDAIMKRKSTRTFTTDDLTFDEINEIRNLLEKYKEVKGPFGYSFDFRLYLNKNEKGKGQKVGTYGMIKNMTAYITGVSLDVRNAIIDFGYVMELVILELTSLGYDSVWLGGTFNRGRFTKKLQPNEIVPVIVPIGKGAEKRSFIDLRIRKSAKSDQRLPFGTLFQYFDEERDLEEIEDSRFIDVMRMVQRGPSASNKQPWRIFVADKHDTVYVYLKRTQGYGLSLGYDIQAIDAGIALAHLESGLKYYDFKFERVEETEDVFFDGLEYIMTYKKLSDE